MTVDCEAIESLQAEGLTQRAIALRLGIAQSTVSKYQNRHKTIEPTLDWGLGAAKLVAPATTESYEVVLRVSDWHVPYHDIAMMESAIALAKALQPHRLDFGGDLGDYFQLSRFNKGLDRLDTLQEEIDTVNNYKARFRAACPDAVIDEEEGNHDERLRTYVQLNARALTSLRAIQPGNLFMWKELEINPHGGNGFLLRRFFLSKHGTIVRGESGATAKAEQTASGISGWSGHTHRLAAYEKAGYVQREWWESGCLARLDPDYVKGSVPNWKSGCLVGLFSTTTDTFAIEPVYRMDDKLLYGGRLY